MTLDVTTQTDDVTTGDVNDAILDNVDDDPLVPSEPPGGQPQAGAPPQATADSLITDEEFNQLVSDPAKLRQTLLERHQARLDQHKDVIEFKEAYDQDPVATVTALAQRLGILKDTAAPPTPKQPSFEEATFTRLSKVLGPQLAGEMTAILIETAKAMSAQAVAPIQQTLQQTSQASQKAAAEAIVRSYFEKNPDALAHKDKMFSLMRKYVPGPEMGDEEWLDLLYEKAAASSAPKQVKDGRKAAAGLIKSTVQQIRGASPANVVPRTPGADGKRGNSSEATKRAAFEAALRGERWED